MSNANSFTAPEQPSNFNEVDPIPVGRHICILFQLVDMGTITVDTGQWGVKDQRKVRLSFEFPNELRKFQDDKPEQPSKVNRKFTFTLSDGSNLTKFINGALGRKLTKNEYKTFDLLSLLGKQYIAKVIHEPKVGAEGFWTNMSTCELVTPGDIEDFPHMPFATTKQFNPSFVFRVDPDGKCFASEGWGKIYGKTREEMETSKEYKKFIADGGKPYVRPQKQEQQGGAPAQAYQEAPPQNAPEQTAPQMENPNTFL